MIKKMMNSTLFTHYILLWVLIALVIIGILSSNVFFSGGNINGLITGRVTVGIIAVAMTICMAAGEMDISMGYMLGSCIMVAAWAATKGASAPVVLLVAFLTGIIYGSLNGFLAVVVKIPSTIVTLGSGMIFYSISMWTNNSKSITGVLPKSITGFFRTKIFGLLPCIWVMLILFVFAYWLLEHTPLGKQIYAVGFSQKVAHLSGIQTKFIKFITFAMCGAIVGIAAVLILGQSGNAYVSTGPSYLMPCLAVAFLSITTHRIGRYNIVGSFLALFALGVAYNIAGLIGAPFWFENIVNGIIIIGVVLMNGKDSRSAHTG
jgi:ribose transport system permease protein